MKIIYLIITLLLAVSVHADSENQKKENQKEHNKMETATLGGGCFWCVEAIYENIKGVDNVVSGYAGGKSPNPDYDQVSSGDSGHAEVVQVNFDPALISFADILKIFFHTHDPTTLNRQGADTGTQYRSVIFYHNSQQKEDAEKVIERITAEKLWANPIVTEISPFKEFFRAEDYHQNYYRNNQNNRYCSLVIGPKIQKLKKEFADKMK